MGDKKGAPDRRPEVTHGIAAVGLDTGVRAHGAGAVVGWSYTSEGGENEVSA